VRGTQRPPIDAGTVALRNATWDDVEAADGLLNRLSEQLFGARESTPGEVRRLWSLPAVEPERDVVLAFDEGGEPIGLGLVFVEDEQAGRIWFDVRGSPASELLSELERRVSARPGLRPVFFRVDVVPGEDEVRSAVETAGYRAIRHSFRMLIDLESDPEPPAWPNGMTVRAFDRQRDAQAVYEVQEETFADVWEHTPQSFEEWAAWMLGETHDPDLWFLVEDGDELAGIALGRLFPTGRPQLGWISVLGVRRPWRRRGIGRALLRHAFGEFHRGGWSRVGLGVDGESETGAVELYERAGMRVDRRFDTYERRL
jgi:ribosomal protein S18 acetylase RimI-like enzyme